MSLRGVLLSTCIAWSTYCSAQITFQKTFGGANNDYAYCVNSTSDRGYIITGWTDGFGAGNRDMYLIRTDSIGNLLWTKTFGGTNNDEGACVIQTLDGGFMTAGTSYSFSVPTSVAYLVKTDASGNVVWSK